MYYSPDRPRTGSNSTIVRDRIEFVRLCLDSAGVPSIPDEDDSLNKGYIKPALTYVRARNAELDRRTQDIARVTKD